MHRDRRFAESRGCRHPQPPPQAEGVGILVTGDRGWRPDGLTPGYCLKPFQGFEGGLGKGRGSLELMTGVVGAWECGDETSPPPKSLTVWMGAGTSRPRKFWVRGGQLATRGRHPAGG